MIIGEKGISQIKNLEMSKKKIIGVSFSMEYQV